MKLHNSKYLFIIKSMSLITLKCVVVGDLIGFVRQKRLLTTLLIFVQGNFFNSS